MKVSLTTTSMRPTLAAEYKKFAALLPDVIFPEKCEVHFDNVNSSFANAFRRTISCELPVKVLEADFHDIVTTEKFIIQENLQQCLSSIALAQDVPPDMIFELKITNTTGDVLNVKSGDITPISAAKNSRKYFNSNITLCCLSPMTSLHIKRIRVAEYAGWQRGYAILATNVASTTDIAKYNAYDNTDGQRSSVSSASSWTLSFVNSGRMESREVVKFAANSLIARLKAAAASEITEYATHSEIMLINETETIAQMLMQHIVQNYGESCTIRPEVGRRTMIMSLTGDARDILDRAAADLIKKVEFVRDKI